MARFRCRLFWSGAVLIGITAAGCNPPADQGGSEMDDLARSLKQPPAAEEPAGSASPVESSRDSEFADHAPADVEIESRSEPADRGEAPADAEEGTGYYSAIVGAHRHITTRVDDLAWKQAVQHYQANTGKMPRTHDEFMTGVIEGFGIDLPPLEEGEEYLYVPDEGQFGELYIVRQQP